MACILVTRELGDFSFPGARRQLRGRHGTASGRLLFEPTPDLYGVVNIKILGYEHYCFGHNSGYFKVLEAIRVDSRRIVRTFNYSFRLRRLSDYCRLIYTTHLQDKLDLSLEGRKSRMQGQIKDIPCPRVPSCHLKPYSNTLSALNTSVYSAHHPSS